MIHGPPPTWPVVTGVSFSHVSGGAAVICPGRDVQRVVERDVRTRSVPGIMQDLVLRAAVLLARSRG